MMHVITREARVPDAVLQDLYADEFRIPVLNVSEHLGLAYVSLRLDSPRMRGSVLFCPGHGGSIVLQQVGPGVFKESITLYDIPCQIVVRLSSHSPSDFDLQVLVEIGSNQDLSPLAAGIAKPASGITQEGKKRALAALDGNRRKTLLPLL